MGFSLKKAVQSVAKVVTAPIVAPIAVGAKVLDKVGVSDLVMNTVGVDVNNIAKVTESAGKLETLGSEATKTALFDSAKIGLGTLGGAGVIAPTTAVGGFLLATKAQQGGGVNAGDVGTLFGVPTNLGGLDFGNFEILKSKAKEVVEEIPQYAEEIYQEVTAPKNRNILYIVILTLTLGASIFIIRKIKK